MFSLSPFPCPLPFLLPFPFFVPFPSPPCPFFVLHSTYHVMKVIEAVPLMYDTSHYIYFMSRKSCLRPINHIIVIAHSFMQRSSRVVAPQQLPPTSSQAASCSRRRTSCSPPGDRAHTCLLSVVSESMAITIDCCDYCNHCHTIVITITFDCCDRSSVIPYCCRLRSPSSVIITFSQYASM